MMLAVAISLLYYTYHPSRAHPVLSAATDVPSWKHSDVYSRSLLNLRDATDPFQCTGTCPADERSVFDILWSCLAVIFACTWVAVHPDVPKPSETSWGGIRHRFWLMLCALIAPELMVIWAMRQWCGARYLSDALEDYGFTRTHGFFAQMGGFMLWEADPASETSKEKRRLGVLYPNQVWNLVVGRTFTFGDLEIDPKDVLFTLPTDENIQDRSKGDGLAKALVLGQTTWFIAQCISRWVQVLQITELELVTLAFAALNGVVYFLWWDKPLDVRYGISVVWKRPGVTPDSAAVAVRQCPQAPAVEGAENGQDSAIRPRSEGEAQDTEKVQHRPGNYPPSHSSDMMNPPSRTRRNSHLSVRTSLSRTQCCVDFRRPLHSITTMYTSVHRELASLRSSFYNSTPAYAMRTSPLYAYINIQTEFLALILSSIVAVLFGAIHCAAWGWTFKTEPERMIWRTSAVIITAAPCVVLLRAATRAWKESHLQKEELRRPQTQTSLGTDAVHELRPSQEDGGSLRAESAAAPVHQHTDPVIVAAMVEKAEAELAEALRLAKSWSAPRMLLWVIVLLVPLYTAARLALLIEALVALRALTSETRTQVDWVQFIPHI